MPQGQFVALMGPNGAGEVFPEVALRNDDHQGRQHRLAGQEYRRLQVAGDFAEGISRCHRALQLPLMTIDENLQMAAYTLRDDKVKSDRDYVYDLFQSLKARRNTLAGNMSGGEQQLLEVAMAVLQRPKILLVDEPSVGLSPAAIAIVFNELLRINAGGQTILLVEQNTKKAMEVAHRAVILRLGRVIWDGRPAEITHDELGELFLTGRMRDETQAEH